MLAVRKRIEERISSEGLRPFAERTGLTVGVVRSMAEGRNVTVDSLMQICEALQMEFYIGPPRETEPVRGVSLKAQDFINIPVHSASLAAGHGAENSNVEVVEHLAFRRDWLMQINVRPSQAVLARTTGDSMVPTIQPNDMVLIDQSRREIPIRKRPPKDTRPAPIYALQADGFARVKRIERPEPEIIMLLSDNPAFGPELISGAAIENLNVIGKVMWWAHTSRD